MLMPLLLTYLPATCPRAHEPESGNILNGPELDGMSVHAALAHQNDFDVCWARGSVSELLFAPLVSYSPPADSALPRKQALALVRTNDHVQCRTALVTCDGTPGLQLFWSSRLNP